MYRNSAVEKYVSPFRYAYKYIYIYISIEIYMKMNLFDFSEYFLNRIEHVVAKRDDFLFGKHVYTMAYDCRTYTWRYVRIFEREGIMLQFSFRSGDEK